MFHCQTFSANEAFKRIPPTYHEWQTLKMYNIIGTLNFFPENTLPIDNSYMIQFFSKIMAHLKS